MTENQPTGCGPIRCTDGTPGVTSTSRNARLPIDKVTGIGAVSLDVIAIVTRPPSGPHGCRPAASVPMP